VKDDASDTVLDGLAAQARAHPPLSIETVAALLAEARRDPRGPAQATLVRHHLVVALDAALARVHGDVDVDDLFQEGSVAVVTAVDEHIRVDGSPAALRGRVGRVVAKQLDVAIERAAAQRRSDDAFVRDSRLLEAAEVELRHRLGRPATDAELAEVLSWNEARVGALSAMLAEARTLHDQSLVPYLDDLE